MIVYEAPVEGYISGPSTAKDVYGSPNIDLRPYVVELAAEHSSGASEPPSSIGIPYLGYVTLKGPLKVAVSVEEMTETRRHTTDIVTIPLNEEVKFNIVQDQIRRALNTGFGYTMQIAPVLKPAPMSPITRWKLIRVGYIVKQVRWLNYDVTRVP